MKNLNLKNENLFFWVFNPVQNKTRYNIPNRGKSGISLLHLGHDFPTDPN